MGVPQAMDHPFGAQAALARRGQAFSQESDAKSYPSCLSADSSFGLIANARGRIQRAGAGPIAIDDAAAKRIPLCVSFTDATKLNNAGAGPTAGRIANSAINAVRAGCASGNQRSARDSCRRACRAAAAANAAAKAGRAQSAVDSASGAKRGTGTGRSESPGRAADPEFRPAARQRYPAEDWHNEL
jgi:hypothetical protein